MNCQEFDQIVVELAADKLSSARTRIVALTHVSTCEACNNRLMAEKVLENGLAAVAESDKGQQASAKLKQSLRAAFEAQQEKIAAETIATNVIRLPIHKSSVRPRWAWSLAAAAVIVFAVSVFVWRNQPTSENLPLIASSSPTPTVTPTPSNQSIEPITPQADTGLKLDGARTLSENSSRKRSPRTNRQRTIQAQENELAANYIPLNYSPGTALSDESLVVRVEVPRTSLIAMGLPLSLHADLGSEMVKADLRVGLDGIPLAIRLVRQ